MVVNMKIFHLIHVHHSGFINTKVQLGNSIRNIECQANFIKYSNVFTFIFIMIS